MGRERSRLVYSTGPEGRGGESPTSCPRCGATPCRCPVVEPRPPAAHAVRVRIERSGRKGKTVTVGGPFYLEREEAARLLAGLKRECGSGGTLKQERSSSGSANLRIEIQGDHVERVIERLAGRGFRARRG